jgi:scyllo-inositol 2-dehydrogenase (NADP+)
MQKIRTALLSYGMSGKVFHAPFIAFHEGFELVGVWERSKKLIQQDFPNVKSYATLEELLQDGIDLVIVNTPVDTHFEYSKKVLLAGKHAIVEKSFTTTVRQAQELDNLAYEKGLKLAVYHNRRWNSDFLTVKKVIEDNILGDIVEVEFRFDRYNPLLSPKVHKETASAGAGILKDLGSHLIDQSLYLFGLPHAVFADIRITRLESLVDDWIDIVLYYPEFRVRLKAGFFVREAHPAYLIHGKKGSFFKPRGDVQEELLKLGEKPNLTNWGIESTEDEGLLHTEIDGELFRGKIPSLSGNYYDFFEGVYQSIINATKEPVTAQEGLDVMRIIEAAIESNAQRKVIEL